MWCPENAAAVVCNDSCKKEKRAKQLFHGKKCGKK